MASPLLESSALYQLWRSKCAARRYPARRDFEVLELAPWIGDLELVEIVREPRLRYRFRLVGTNITAIDGRDVTGRFADEIFSPDIGHITREYDTVLRTGEPCLVEGVLKPNLRGLTMVYRKLVLPLAADGETIDMLMVHLRELGSPFGTG
jgi:hypothetical protein